MATKIIQLKVNYSFGDQLRLARYLFAVWFRGKLDITLAISRSMPQTAANNRRVWEIDVNGDEWLHARDSSGKILALSGFRTLYVYS
jgi:hypothetical protein